MAIVGSQIRLITSKARLSIESDTSSIPGAIYFSSNSADIYVGNGGVAKKFSGIITAEKRPSEPIVNQLYWIGVTGKYKLESFINGRWESVGGDVQYNNGDYTKLLETENTWLEKQTFNKGISIDGWEFTKDSNGHLILTGATDKDLHVSGNVHAFSETSPPVSSWWDDMPIASATVLGGIKVGANLTIDANGVLNAEAGGGGGADWGNIGGTLSDQTDLWNALQARGLLSGGNTWYDSQIFSSEITVSSVGNSTQWQAGYSHSQITTGNPHGLNLADIGESYADINYWTKTANDLSYSAGDVEIGMGKSIIIKDENDLSQWTLNVDSNGHLILTGATDKDLHVSGNVHAFSETSPPASSWWDDMPIATDTVLGGIKQGTGITIEADGTANVIGGGTAAIWGQITGTLSNQTDLQSELDVKGNLSGGNTWSGIQTVNADIRFQNNALVSLYVDSNNIDHIWHDDTNNAWNFVSDAAYKATGNSRINGGSFYANGLLVATQSWVNSQGYLTSESDTLQTVIARQNDYTTALNFTPNAGSLINIDNVSCIYRTTTGGGMAFGANDGTILGAGEALSAMKSNVDTVAEAVYIGGEEGVRFYSFPNNDTTWSNRHEMVFANSGTLTVPTSISCPQLFGNASTATTASGVTVNNNETFNVDKPIVWNNAGELYQSPNNLLFNPLSGELTCRLFAIDRADSSGESAIRYSSGGVNEWFVGVDNNQNYYGIYSYGLGDWAMNINKSTGNVRIGDDSAAASKLEVVSDGITHSILNSSNLSKLDLGTNNNGSYITGFASDGSTASLIRNYEVSGVQAYFVKGGISIGDTINSGNDERIAIHRISGKPSIKANTNTSDTAGWMIMDSAGTGTGRVSLNRYTSDDVEACFGGGNFYSYGDVVAYA